MPPQDNPMGTPTVDPNAPVQTPPAPAEPVQTPPAPVQPPVETPVVNPPAETPAPEVPGSVPPTAGTTA